MKQVAYSIVFFICVIIIGCDTSKEYLDKAERIEISPSDGITISKEQIFDDYNIIRLHNDSLDMVTGIISNVKIIDSTIYISDDESLYLCDFLGNIKRKISKLGAGHDEYKSIQSFDIDTKGNIWVLSRRTRQLVKYGTNGKFYDRIQLDFYANDLCVVDDNHILLYLGNEMDGNHKNNLCLLNTDSKKIEKEYLPISEKKSQYMFIKSNMNFNSLGQDKCFFELFNDTIYQYDDNGVEPKYIVDFSLHKIPNNLYENDFRDIREFFTNIHENKYAYSTGIFTETDKNIVLSYIYDMKKHIVVKSKNDNSTFDFTGIIGFSFCPKYTLKLADYDQVFIAKKYLLFQFDMLNVLSEIKNNMGEDEYSNVMKKLNFRDYSGTYLLIGKFK